MKLFLIALLGLVVQTLRAQDHNPLPLQDSHSVRIHEDPRIALIVTRPAPAYTGKAKGFRVQIYNGSDRNKANQIKLAFMRNHPGVRAYLIYNKPYFRVRVGNFTSRAAAEPLYRELSSKYTCMIVPEIIYLPPPHAENQNNN